MQTTTPAENPSNFEALARAGERIGRALQRDELSRAVSEAGAELLDAEACCHGLPDPTRALVGSSPRIRRVVEQARQAANRHAPILLTGERGAGHEELARAIHAWSPRREGPFVSLHASGLSPEQQGLALFGRETSFPTADLIGLRGAIERAAGGTLFLGEVGALSAPHQAALQRVLEEQTFRPVGADDDRRRGVRMIAATRRDLRSQIERGCFSQELYSRLCVVSIDLPSLSERSEDIPLLAETLVEQLCRQHDRPPLRIGPAALGCLVGYVWPGNLAELANTLERAVLLAKGEGIGVRLLPPEVRGWSVAADKSDLSGFDDEVPLSRAVAKFKSERIQSALAKTDGNQTRAARLLGLQQSNLSRMMKNLRIR